MPIPKLKTLIVEKSISVAFFSLIKLPPKPESIKVRATKKIIDTTPITPKSSGVRNLAKIIVDKMDIKEGKNLFNTPQKYADLCCIVTEPFYQF